ncbi:glycogen debranching protein GlgX [Frankia sp. Mgl5]|uniref:glycogen debranching protein GlgX n=1 Tax=Frankia sp. Mgl5 TaxID=2933793 RepID=UPI00200C2E54|nr:glycogen debranching protein GlgX [Frankia sp. Mgl5]MCK9930523.1 glycogen debranching protein GlgX [Frankia sp. Mgl5]
MIRPGSATPLGVWWDGEGVNVAVVAPGADAVDFCVFDGQDGRDGSGATGRTDLGTDPAPGTDGGAETTSGGETRYRLPERDGGVWHGYIPGVGPGQAYGLRAHGPYAPGRGERYNPAKLLLDPYARRVTGSFVPHPAVHGYVAGDPYGQDPDDRDSAPYVPKGVVTGPVTRPPAGSVTGSAAGSVTGPDPAANRPRTAWADTILYELHVRGFTMLHPGVPERLRGTYAGLAHPAVVDHLLRIGVTAVELLPVHAHISETTLLENGRSNYWGYNTLAFFAPHPGYAATDDPVAEFRAMVAALHDAGIEVLLDVVYNHTAEGSERGPTLSLRGLDNIAYYRVEPTDPRRYRDVTGCGNTVDATSPHVVRLICDSLRYWVSEMGVDGFRFDLATALARSPDGFEPAAPLLTAIQADPLLSSVKLIAEPWDLGWGGYQVGAFPAPWAEWNGRFRDTLRDIFSDRTGSVADLGYRITGSSDIYEHSGRRPWASVNFVTAHDGFPLADLVSYNEKHNEDNGEGNRDGESENRSSNHGAEGPTDDPKILTNRRRARRALISTLLLSAGVPMLLAGDELGRSQGGNNNAYCQDNAVSWLAWPNGTAGTSEAGGPGDGPASEVPAADPAGPDPALITLVGGLSRLRRAAPVLRRQRFFRGGAPTPQRLPDITWFRQDGAVMSAADWNAPQVAILVAHLAGEGIEWTDAAGTPVTGESLLLVIHPEGEDRTVVLPGTPWATRYDLLLDTAADDLAGFPATIAEPRRTLAAGAQLDVAGRTVLILRALGGSDCSVAAE